MGLICLALLGCGREMTLETIADQLTPAAAVQPREISVRLPDDALAPVLDSNTQQMYVSEEYEIVIETLSAGDLDGTIQAISGFDRDKVTLMQTQRDDVTRYDFVWASAGEEGQRLGRGVILDDGTYHYCMTALRDADTSKTSQIVWSDVFGSFSLV